MRKSVNIRIGNVDLASDGLDSEAGDIVALEAIIDTTNISAVRTGWTKPVDLNSPPEGITVANFGGELRVTSFDVHNIDGQDTPITGTMEDESFKNLKKMTMLDVRFNGLTGKLPFVTDSLVYYYVGQSDDIGGQAQEKPHIEDQNGLGLIHKGYNDGSSANKFSGNILERLNPNASNLEWFWMDWTAVTGVIPDEILEYHPKLKGLSLFVNRFEDTPIPDLFNLTPDLERFEIGYYPNSDPIIPENERPTYTGDFPQTLGLLNLSHYYMRTLPLGGSLPENFAGSKTVTAKVVFSSSAGSLDTKLMDGTSPNIHEINFEHNGNMIPVAFPESVPNLSALRLLYLPPMSGPVPQGIVKSNLIAFSSYFGQITFLPEDWTVVNTMRDLVVHDNNIRGALPKFQWDGTFYQTVNFNKARFHNNYYTFKDMLMIDNVGGVEKTRLQWYEDIIGASVTKSFVYAPQKQFGFGSDFDGSVIDFGDHVNHFNNVYVWRKDGDIVSGATGSAINVITHGNGSYQLTVTNDMAPDLTLTSISINVNN